MPGFPIKSAPSQAAQKPNKNVKPTSAAAQLSLRKMKLFKTTSSEDCSIKSVSTAATEQDEFRVRFSEKIVVRKIISRKNYTAEEIQACWFTAEELQRIHRHCGKEIRRLNEGMKLKDKKYCSRGLEGYTIVGAATKKKIRLLAINAVLDEQMIQWDAGVFDEDSIAEIYCNKASSRCQLDATNVGFRHHRETAESSANSRSRRGRSRGVASRAA